MPASVSASSSVARSMRAPSAAGVSRCHRQRRRAISASTSAVEMRPPSASVASRVTLADRSRKLPLHAASGDCANFRQCVRAWLMATLAYEQVCERATQFGENGVSAQALAAAPAKEVRAYEASAAFTCTVPSEHATTSFEVIGRFSPVKFETQPIEGGWKVTVASR